MRKDKFRLAIWDADSQRYKYLQDQLSSNGEMVFSLSVIVTGKQV